MKIYHNIHVNRGRRHKLDKLFDCPLLSSDEVFHVRLHMKGIQQPDPANRKCKLVPGQGIKKNPGSIYNVLGISVAV